MHSQKVASDIENVAFSNKTAADFLKSVTCYKCTLYGKHCILYRQSQQRSQIGCKLPYQNIEYCNRCILSN